MHHVVLMEQYITHMITRSSFTILLTLTNLALFILKPPQMRSFRVCCEAIPRQVNFLIGETVLTGKGANSMISYVHYYFKCHANAFMWYYLWRVMTGLHHAIEYNFLLAGHTKFSPDWCFGLVKQKAWKTFISSLFDITRAVEESTTVNTAEFVGIHNRTVLIPTYDWTTYLGHFFKKIPRLKSYNHFRFDQDYSGTVFCKEYWSSEEVAMNILQSKKNLPQLDLLPPVIPPTGISRGRAEYLYKEFREFCRPGTEEFVAPAVK